MLIRGLRYAALLFLLVFIADRSLYFIIKHVQNKTFRGIHGGKINDYLRQSTTPELVIMGPSSPAFQLNPASFSVFTYNLGHPDTEDAFQTALLSELIRKKKTPENILLYINPYAYMGKDSADLYSSKSPLKLGYLYNSNDYVTEYINELGVKEKVKNFFLLTRYNNRIFPILKDYLHISNSVPVRGFFPFTASARDSITVTADYNRYKEFRQKNPQGAYFIQSDKMKYLKTFVQLCRENNITLILFTLPGYIEVADKYVDDMASESFSLFCRRNNLRYFDFRKSELCNLINQASFWKDIQHLNELGSPVESRFVSDAISPFLRKK